MPKIGTLGIRQKSIPPAYHMPKNSPPGVRMPNSKSLTEALALSIFICSITNRTAHSKEKKNSGTGWTKLTALTAAYIEISDCESHCPTTLNAAASFIHPQVTNFYKLPGTLIQQQSCSAGLVNIWLIECIS